MVSCEQSRIEVREGESGDVHSKTDKVKSVKICRSEGKEGQRKSRSEKGEEWRHPVND
jgi:hypothetical protein